MHLRKLINSNQWNDGEAYTVVVAGYEFAGVAIFAACFLDNVLVQPEERH